jgi:hypothetical protein
MHELTELERVKLENYMLRIVYMQQQLQQMQNERVTFIRQLEVNHPGYEWNEQHGLVREEEAVGAESASN